MPVYLKKSRARNPRRADKRWLVVVEHRGQRAEFIVYGTRREAEDLEATERLKLKARAPSALRAALPFSEFCSTLYRPHAELKLKASTWYRAKFMVATLVGYFAEKRLDQIGQGDVEGYQQTRRDDGLNAVSVNNECRILRRILNYAAERGIAVTGDIVKFLKEPERRARVWTDEQVQAVLRALTIEAPGDPARRGLPPEHGVQEGRGHRAAVGVRQYEAKTRPHLAQRRLAAEKRQASGDPYF